MMRWVCVCAGVCVFWTCWVCVLGSDGGDVLGALSHTQLARQVLETLEAITTARESTHTHALHRGEADITHTLQRGELENTHTLQRGEPDITHTTDVIGSSQLTHKSQREEPQTSHTHGGRSTDEAGSDLTHTPPGEPADSSHTHAGRSADITHTRTGRSTEAVRRAPEFMLQLFATLEHTHTDALSDSHTNSSPGSSPYADLLEGTVVRSFQDKGQRSAGGANGAFHFFSVTSLGRDERVLRAELRWYRRRQPHTHHFYKVDLYEVLNSGVQPWRGNLISSRLLPTHTQGWEIFNITHTVSRWVSDSSSNNGLLLVSSLSPWRWMEATPPNTDGPAPYLVVFSADEDSTAPSAPPPPGMMTSPGDKKRKRRSASARGQEQEGAGSAEPCHRKSLYVDFRLIGWSSWIIAPPGYEAFQCSGTCVFPLGEGTRASNHATVQALTHTLSPVRTHARTHTPCCVPDALAPVSLLYFDEHDNVVLRQYRDMVAESCGCH